MTTLDDLIDQPHVDHRQDRAERLARINERAADIHIGLSLLNVIALVLITVGKAVGGTFNAVQWCWAALAEGFREVRPAKAPRADVARR